jgi:hypothetical protein
MEAINRPTRKEKELVEIYIFFIFQSMIFAPRLLKEFQCAHDMINFQIEFICHFIMIPIGWNIN